MDQLPQRLGEDVYNAQSPTGRNRSVVDDVAVLTAGGGVWGANGAPAGLPGLEASALRLVRDGSLVLVDGGSDNWYWMEHSTVPLPGLIFEYQASDSGLVKLKLLGSGTNWDAAHPYTEQMRVFILQGASWTAWLVDGKALALLRQRELRALAVNPGDFVERLGLKPDDKVQPIPAARCYAHSGGLGLLYWAQHPLNRIEQVAQDTAESLNKINRLPVISGDTGPADEARGAINSAENAIVFPGPVTIDRMISDAVIRALQVDGDARTSDLYDALNALDKEGANRPVASDRVLRMQVMLQYVDNLHAALIQIYADWGAKLSFRRLVVEAPDALIQRKTLLDSCRLELEAAAPGEYQRQVLALFGL